MSYKPHPPASNVALVAHYWANHFELCSTVAPAPFIHRIMTDYRNDDIVAEWIRDMSPLYKLYNACTDYGIKNGSPLKSIEARNYPGVIEFHKENN